MPLGWKVDWAMTKLAYENGRFMDKRSRVDMKGHDHLAGVDMGDFRYRAHMRAQGYCEFCGTPAGSEGGELHHDPDGYERYDSLESVKWACQRCHRKQHPQTHLGTIKGV